MTNIVNLQRDGSFQDVQSAAVQWSASTINQEANAGFNADPTVYDTYARVHTPFGDTVTIGTNEHVGVGLYIRQPGSSMVPYRVKAHAQSNNQAVEFILAVGIGPASPTGLNDFMSPWNPIPFRRDIDELIMVPALPDGDPLINNPMAFAVLAYGEAGPEAINVNLSVQSLATAPPQFAQSTS